MNVIKAKDSAKIECLVHYLREENRMSDESFDSVGNFYGDYSDCKELVRQNLNDIADNTKLQLNEVTGLRQYTNCVMNQLKQHDAYEQNVLLSQVLDYAKVSWKFWTFFDRNSLHKRAMQEITTIEEEKVNYCVNNIETSTRQSRPSTTTEESESDEYDDEGCGSGEHDRVKRDQDIIRRVWAKGGENEDLFFEQSRT